MFLNHLSLQSDMVNLVKIVGLGLAGVTAILFLREAASKGLGVTAQQSGIGFGTLGQSIGTTLGGIGSGIGQFGAGVGEGASKLFNPLFTLRDLVYGPQAGQQAAPTSATEGLLPSEQPTTQGQPQIQKRAGALNFEKFKFHAGPVNVVPTAGSGMFGGYGSQENQINALASAMSESARKYPQWFR